MLYRAAVLGFTAVLAAGCQTGPGVNTAIGAGGGAAAGAGIGLLTADSGDGVDQRQRALIGAGIGAVAGGALGLFLDQQEQQLNQDLAGTGVSVEREGEALNVIFPDVTFQTGSSEITPQFYESLNAVSRTLIDYPESLINVYGHTDDVGSRPFNQGLSEDRARAVATYLRAQGVQPQRILTQGFGEDLPRASNATAAGRAQNRRVEIEIIPITA